MEETKNFFKLAMEQFRAEFGQNLPTLLPMVKLIKSIITILM